MPFFIKTSQVRALTVEEILNQISELQATIEGLQQSQSEQQEQSWCHDFNVSLKYGDTGKETQALQIALEKEGFSIPNSEKLIGSYFGPNTASGVVGFQEKYSSEILEERNLEHGTGFAGQVTRNKLNKIYGCNAVMGPSLEIISPDGGEAWEPGKEYAITWKSKNLDYIIISLIHDENICAINKQPIEASLQSYTYNLSTGDCTVPVSEEVKIQISKTDGLILDSSDEYFSVVSGKISCEDNVCSAEETFESCAQDCGHKISPYDADVDICSDDNGAIYPAIGPSSANWFVENCAQRKYYEVNPEEKIFLVTRTDKKECYHPDFYIHEQENEKWEYKKYFDLINVRDNTQSSSYVPETDKIRIHAPKCFYLDIYTENPVVKETSGLVSPSVEEKLIDSNNSNLDDTTEVPAIIEKEEVCNINKLWSWDYCSVECPCDAGEGDCATNEDCETGYCAQNVGSKYNQYYSMDVCEEKSESELEPNLEPQEPIEEQTVDPLGLPNETTPESP